MPESPSAEAATPVVLSMCLRCVTFVTHPHPWKPRLSAAHCTACLRLAMPVLHACGAVKHAYCIALRSICHAVPAKAAALLLFAVRVCTFMCGCCNPSVQSCLPVVVNYMPLITEPHLCLYCSLQCACVLPSFAMPLLQSSESRKVPFNPDRFPGVEYEPNTHRLATVFCGSSVKQVSYFTFTTHCCLYLDTDLPIPKCLRLLLTYFHTSETPALSPATLIYLAFRLVT